MEWWHSRSTPRLLVSQVLTAAGYRAGALMTAGTLALVVAGCSLNEFVTTCPSSSPGVRVPVECADPGGWTEKRFSSSLAMPGMYRLRKIQCCRICARVSTHSVIEVFP